MLVSIYPNLFLCHAARLQLALLVSFCFPALQDEIEHELDPLFKLLVQKSINSTIENEDILQKTQIEWERLNVETNERLYVLQRAHTLYSEIELLRKRVETTVHRVDIVLSETITSSNSFQQAKNHLNKLKVI
jgi:uncharacterized membrane protein YgaE (UPF0421/DUF939 family)